MTPASPRFSVPRTDPPLEPRPDLHLSQVLASALAAVTAAVVGSTLGVAGTLAGAAVGSVIATSGSAIYTYWLSRTGHRVRAVVVRTTEGTVVRTTDSSANTQQLPALGAEPTPPLSRTRRRTWQLGALLSVSAFLLGMVVITGFEAITGAPVSTLTTGHDSGGTSLGDVFNGDTSTAQPTPVSTSSDTSTEAPNGSPTTSPTSTPTPSATPTTSPTVPPESTTSPSQTPPTSSPTGTPTPPPT